MQAARVLRDDASLDALVRDVANHERDGEGLDASLALALSLARALLEYGMSSQRVEEALFRLAATLDLCIDVFCLPTALIVTLSNQGAASPEHVRTRVVRVEPGTIDLEKLSALHDLVGRVERKELSPGDAARRVDAIRARPARGSHVLRPFGFGLISTVSAALLGGGFIDLPLAGVLGLSVGLLEASAHRVFAIARLLPTLAAFAISLITSLLVWQGLPVHPPVLLLSAIIVLLPGFTVTTAITELATAHLASGTARLMGGSVTFLQLGFGVALGHAVATMLSISASPPASPEANWTVFFAPFVSALGYTILLRAKPSDARWVLLAVLVAFGGSQIGARSLGPELGAFVGALAVASCSHAFARWRDRPVSLMLVPGTLFLVPGSIGFLSVSSLLENDVVNAVQTGFRMVLVATALAAGLLVATAAVPPRKAL